MGQPVREKPGWGRARGLDGDGEFYGGGETEEGGEELS